jgi:crotonobetainyl-CoA:carnitine CoA-transferase CaiB-like acyl-CoA transferase
MPILSDLSIIEISGDGAAAMAAKQLADWGAAVTIVEPVGGSPLRTAPPYYEKDGVRKSGTWEWLSRGKTSVTGLSHADARSLCEAADVVLIESEVAEPVLGLNQRDVRSAFEGKTTCVLISPFATDGPYGGYQATDLGVNAMGGWMSVLGSAEREPVRPGGDITPRVAGLFGLVAALVGLRHREAGGEPQFVDISKQAAAASMIVAPWLVKSMIGMDYERRGNSFPMGPMMCKDGWVGIPPLTPTHWEMMCQLMGIGDIFENPQAHDFMWRMQNSAALGVRVQPWLDERTRLEVFEQAQAYRLPASMMQTAADRLECPQLAARDFWRTAEVDGKTVKVPRVSYTIDGLEPVERPPLASADGLAETTVEVEQLGSSHTTWRLDDARSASTKSPVAQPLRRDGAPRRDGAQPPELPFDGIRVLDLTWFWSGPYAMMMMAALGADVIKVESSQRPDPYRYIWAPVGKENWWEWGPLWVDTNCGKRGVAMDLAHPEGKAIFERMVAESDVVISNFANRVMPNLGLTPERLLEINPRLIAVTMPGYGPGGPWENYVGYGVAFEQTVCASMTGYPDDSPAMMGGFCDPVVGLHTVAAITLALKQRDATGKGTAIEVPQCETLDSIFAPEHIAVQHGAEPPLRQANKHPWMAPHNAYRTAGTDSWLTIAVASDAEFAALTKAIGLAEDPRFATVESRKQNEEALDAAVSEAVKDADSVELEKRLQAVGVKACRVVKAYALPDDRGLQHIGFFREMTREITGTHPQKQWPFRFSGLDQSHKRPAPVQGQHNAEVLKSIAGVSDSDFERLEAEGVIGGAIKAFAG